MTDVHLKQPQTTYQDILNRAIIHLFTNYFALIKGYLDKDALESICYQFDMTQQNLYYSHIENL